MQILCITSVKDEAPYLVEWLAHYRGLGVDAFEIYHNDCTDGTEALLEEVAQEGWLTHHANPFQGKRTVQWQALVRAAKSSAYLKADWVLFVDVDEFLTLRAPHETLHSLIETCPDGTDAVTLPWRFFGSNGAVAKRDEPVTERFSRAAPLNLAVPAGHFFKSLYRPSAFRAPGVHRPKAGDTPPNWVNSELKPLPDVFAEQNNRINLWGHFPNEPALHLNHYAVKSAQEFMGKRARGLPNKMDLEIGLGYWVGRNFNQQACTRIARHAARTAETVERLRTPQVRKIEAHANKHHEEQFKALVSQRREAELYWLLQLAGGSNAPHPRNAHSHLERLRKAQDG